ncbi:MAG: lipopolysaccharide core heptose(I) kinase RfaP, partial [Gammaproteobacteria bacterium]
GLDIYYGADFCYFERVRKERTPLSRLMLRYIHYRSYEKAVFGTNSQTLILSLSERGNKVYQEYYYTPDSRFFLLPPTLDIDRKPVNDRNGTRKLIRKEFGIADDALLLLFIGSGFDIKGLDRAVLALAGLPTALQNSSQLMVIGNDHPGAYQSLAEQLGVGNRVHFLGGRLEIPDFLAASDLLLHPAYRENTGTILLEAITAGVPVLTTNVCGYAHHVQHAGAGTVLSSPFDQERLNRELADVLESPMRTTWQANGLKYGENEHLYRMPMTAVDVIERYCRKELDNNSVTVSPPVGSVRYLDERLSVGALRAADFDQIMQRQGEGELIRTSRDGSRKTSRLKFGDRTFYLKTHTGVGWSEIIKNWTYLRLPVLGAKNEWHGVHHLERHDIDTLTIAGYGTSGGYATRRSFIITEEIQGSISLEELGYEWQRTPPRKKSELRYKRWLIRRIAEVARTIHQSGANHRDFYLGHFLLQRAYDDSELSIEKSKLYVIDLHRMQIRREIPERWKLKDISGLRYSCLALIEAGLLTQRDLYRFISTYQGAPLREALSGDQSFWSGVVSKAENLRAAEQRKNQANSLETAETVTTARAQH